MQFLYQIYKTKKTQSKKGLSFYAINQPKNYKL